MSANKPQPKPQPKPPAKFRKPKRDGMTARQMRAIEALLSVGSIAGAARKVKVSERTVRRWLAEETFRRTYDEARTGALVLAIGRLQGSANRAVGRLAKGIGAAKDSDALRAAESLLTFCLKATSEVDVIRRLQALEARLDQGAAVQEDAVA